MKTNTNTYDFSSLTEHWLHGWAECLACGHKWIAVWPLGAEALECSNCHSLDTDRTTPD